VKRTGQEVYYVQYVLGRDLDNVPVADAKPIGPKLEEKLHGVFRWKRYWELSRDTVVLGPGQVARRKVSTDREVEIEQLDTEKLRFGSTLMAN